MFANPKTRCVALLVIGMLLVDNRVSVADDEEKGTATAPSGTDVFETSFEGTWFVDRKLKKRYDALIASVSDVEQRVRKGKLSANAARDEIAKLRETLAGVRKMIDESKMRVNVVICQKRCTSQYMYHLLMTCVLTTTTSWIN